MEPQKDQTGGQEKGNSTEKRAESRNMGRQESKKGKEEKACAGPVEGRKEPGEGKEGHESTSISSWQTH